MSSTGSSSTSLPRALICPPTRPQAHSGPRHSDRALLSFRHRRFTYSKARGWSFDYYLSRSYHNFENYSGQNVTWNGQNYTAPMYTDLPWGLGAWGAGSVRVCAPCPALAQLHTRPLSPCPVQRARRVFAARGRPHD